MTPAAHDSIPGTEREPIESFLERIRPRVKRVLRAWDIPPEDAEDIAQEALLEALRKWDSILHLESWLLGTLGFKCSHYWRRQRGDRIQSVDLPDLEGLAPPQPPAQERDEILLDLHSLMRGLGKKHRAALWYRFGLGLSTEEVAERLGYCSSSVRKLTLRALARLHRWAQEGAVPGEPSGGAGPKSA